MAKLAIEGGEPVRTKPFPSWPIWDDTELNALKEVLESGQWGLSSPKIPEFEEAYARYVGTKHAICVTSGTVALQTALTAIGVGVGDEVIIPPYTFMATATAVIMSNAMPVFADIDPETYNIDPAAIEKAITKNTKAIIPVHVAGCPADMDAIMEIAQKYNLFVIEDAAQAHAAEWKGQKVGSIGHLGCFSFQSSKNLNSGEGGIVTTNDDNLAEICWAYHNCGRTKGASRHESHYFGANFRMTAWQAAILLAQMKRLDEQTAIRNRNGIYLSEKLSEIDGIKPVKRDERVTVHAYHLYMFRYNSKEFGGKSKSEFLRALSAEGIPCSPGYSPLYKHEMFKLLDYDIDYANLNTCPVTEYVCREEAIWLYQTMMLGTKEDMDDIVTAIKKIKENFC